MKNFIFMLWTTAIFILTIKLSMIAGQDRQARMDERKLQNCLKIVSHRE